MDYNTPADDAVWSGQTDYVVYEIDVSDTICFGINVAKVTNVAGWILGSSMAFLKNSPKLKNVLRVTFFGRKNFSQALFKCG